MAGLYSCLTLNQGRTTLFDAAMEADCKAY